MKWLLVGRSGIWINCFTFFFSGAPVGWTGLFGSVVEACWGLGLCFFGGWVGVD